ncbi:MAG: FAD-binding oxidoreductase [Thermodesulfobacteriota bacterium]
MPERFPRSRSGRATRMIDEFFHECGREGIPVLRSDFEDFLRDESRFRGHASGVARPRSESQLIALVSLANRFRMPLTTVGGKTSVTGSSVPVEGIAVDVRGLDHFDPNNPGFVGPGVILDRYKELVDQRGFFFPPDPTSSASCTLGGIVACNASGALSYAYGPTRDHVRGLRMLLPMGSVLELQRGDITSRDGYFTIPRKRLSPPPDADLVISVPKLRSPAWKICKNAAGLFSADPMDLVDLFIGSEGLLGIILEIRTVLRPRRSPFFALMLYTPSLEATPELVRTLAGLPRGDGAPAGVGALAPSCMEWIGATCGEFVSKEFSENMRGSYGCLYVEQDYSQGEDPFEKAGRWGESLERLVGLGGIRIEGAFDTAQIRRMRLERQAIPEKLNDSIAPGMVKIATDFAVPLERLPWLMRLYDDRLRGLRHYAFGHIGNAHLHVNILPGDAEEADLARSLCESLARQICEVGGTVSAEHGIGKLKHRYLEIMLGREGLEEIRKVKQALDPHGILNRGNMVPWEQAS